MATHKQGGKTSQHVSPSGKRLGAKVASGQKVTPGRVLVRQSGTRFSAGKGVKVARDHTLFSMISGTVNFGQRLGKKIISVLE